VRNSGRNFTRPPGTRFDVGSRRVASGHGIRNFRQALASPYPAVHFTDPARLFYEDVMKHAVSRVALVAALAALASACALGLRSPSISELKNNPGRYQNRSVNIDGVVTTSWGVPLVPYRFYRVDDGTGEVTVLSSSGGLSTPTRGARVRVRGKVNEVAVFGGQALGLHLREESLRIRRGDELAVTLIATAVMSSLGGAPPRNV
jgi:hypothetical protein